MVMKLRYPRSLVPLALMLAAMLCSFLCLEVMLRAVDWERRESKIVCLDPIMHNVYCPNVEGNSNSRDQAPNWVKINSEGMVDREYGREKPVDAIRIALLGSSVSASAYLSEAQKFKALWERDLTQELGRPTEVLNFAIDGQATWEQLQMFHLRAGLFHPDYVVLVFTWGRDVWSNLASLDRGRPNPLKDEYQLPSWKTRLQVGHRSAIRLLWNHSVAFQFLETLRETIETRRIYEHAAKVQKVATVAEARKSDAGILDDPAYQWDSEAWQLTRQLIARLKQETSMAGVPLIVFSIPTLDNLLQPQPLPFLKFRDFLATQGIPSVDAFDSLARLPESRLSELYGIDHVHLTPQGHRYFAEKSLTQLAEIIARSSPDLRHGTIHAD